MLSTGIVGLLLAWLTCLTFGFTLGGLIHLLPVAAVPLIVMKVMRRNPPHADYVEWEKDRAARRAR